MIKDEISKIISHRVKLHLEDDFETQKCWDEEIKILSRDISETLNFIENDCDDEIFCWIAEIFEDVAEITQSKEFVESIKNRAAKIVDEENRHSVETDIHFAESQLDLD